LMRRELPNSFLSVNTTSIGPALFRKCLDLYCPGKLNNTVSQEEYQSCQDIIIFPTKYFYPFHYDYDKIMKIFVTGGGFGKKFLKLTEAYTLHLYGSLTNVFTANLKSDSVLAETVRKNCPAVYGAADIHNLDL
ncbi:hypothetical protein SK128_001183, partial [Halocaridina rubra]